MTHYFRLRIKTASLSFISSCFVVSNAIAAVTIEGTRVIYDGDKAMTSVVTRNVGKKPSLVQVWTDDGSKTQDINSLNIPFSVLPPLYRIDPGRGQTVRLRFNGMKLPQDRESLFWFNLREIPPVSSDTQAESQLKLAFTTRIKIFYRPKKLVDKKLMNYNSLIWRQKATSKGVKLIITNPTPYYYSYAAVVGIHGNTYSNFKLSLVPPLSTIEAEQEKPLLTQTMDHLKVTLISDLGAMNIQTLGVKPGDNSVLQIQDTKNKLNKDG